MKKVGAVLLFVISGILMLGFFSQITNVLSALIALFSYELTAYQYGEVFGTIIFQIFIFTLALFLFKKGRKLIEKEPDLET